MVEHNKECPEYHGELQEYATGAFLTYFNKVTHAMTEKRDGCHLAYPRKAEKFFCPFRAFLSRGH